MSTSIPAALDLRLGRSSQLQGGGKIGPCPSKTANPSDAAPFRAQHSHGPDRHWWSCSWWRAPWCCSTRSSRRSQVHPRAVLAVPRGDRQRRPREERTGHDHDDHDQRRGPNRRGRSRPTWRRSRPATSPPISSTISARRGYEVDGQQPNALTGFILQMVLFVALFGGLYYFLFRRIGGGATSALNLGRNKVKIYDRKEMKTSFDGRRGRGRGEGGAPRDRRLPEEPEEVPAARRPDPEGRPVARSARMRQDVARQGGRRRGERPVLLHVGVGVRRDVRRAGRRSRPRAVPAGEGEGAGPRVPRRDRHDRQGSRGADERQLRRPRRARADPQPAAGRDGRFRCLQGRDHHGGHEPTGRAGSGADPAGPIRPSGCRGSPRPERTRGDPPRARPRRGAGSLRRPEHDRCADARVHRGRSRERRERGGAARGAPREERGLDGGARGGDRSGDRGPRAEVTGGLRLAEGTGGRSRDGPRARRAQLSGDRSPAPRHDHPARGGGARDHDDEARSRIGTS